MSEKQISTFKASEIEVNFDKKLTDEEWDELFSKSKETAKCDGTCAAKNYGRLYNGNDGKCNFCGFVR